MIAIARRIRFAPFPDQPMTSRRREHKSRRQTSNGRSIAEDHGTQRLISAFGARTNAGIAPEQRAKFFILDQKNRCPKSPSPDSGILARRLIAFATVFMVVTRLA